MPAAAGPRGPIPPALTRCTPSHHEGWVRGCEGVGGLSPCAFAPSYASMNSASVYQFPSAGSTLVSSKPPCCILAPTAAPLQPAVAPDSVLEKPSLGEGPRGSAHSSSVARAPGSPARLEASAREVAVHRWELWPRTCSVTRLCRRRRQATRNWLLRAGGRSTLRASMIHDFMSPARRGTENAAAARGPERNVRFIPTLTGLK